MLARLPAVLLTCLLLARTAQAPPPNSYCLACEAAVQSMGSQGCKIICTALPPGPEQEICEWVLGYSQMCASIEAWLKKGLNDTEICTHIGFCGSDCQCGVCTQATAGPEGRCLGIPNSCGHNASALVPSVSTHAVSASAVDSQGRTTANRSEVCFDGQCGDPKSIGCCVTCL